MVINHTLPYSSYHTWHYYLIWIILVWTCIGLHTSMLLRCHDSITNFQRGLNIANNTKILQILIAALRPHLLGTRCIIPSCTSRNCSCHDGRGPSFQRGLVGRVFRCRRRRSGFWSRDFHVQWRWGRRSRRLGQRWSDVRSSCPARQVVIEYGLILRHLGCGRSMLWRSRTFLGSGRWFGWRRGLGRRTGSRRGRQC